MRCRFSERLRSEAGYSLVEVLAAIMILSLAIIPMVGMFDAGLRAVSTSGNFDKARALANEELESIRALPYYERDAPVNSAREFYPPVNGPSGGGPVACQAALPSGIDSCEVTTNFVAVGSSSVAPDPNARNMMQVEVTVRWGSNGSYTTIGLISQETV